MPSTNSSRPESTEYAPAFEKYVSIVPEGDVVATLGSQFESTLSLLRGIPEDRADFRYAPGKWSIKELVGHVADSERVFAARALRFARNDQAPLPGFEQDDYIQNANFGELPLSAIVEDFEAVRRATITLFRNLSDTAWGRRGVANNNEVSVRALAYIVAGHELHHMQILRTRCL